MRDVSNSLLQTCCNCATGDILTLETWDRELFLISRVISSAVDFVCNSYQEHNYSSFTVWSPLRSELGAKFFLSGEVVLASTLVCHTRVCKSGVFVTVNSINSVYSVLLCAWVCIVCFLPRCAQLSVNNVLLLVRHFVTWVVNFCNLCRQFLSFRARFLGVILLLFGDSCREITLWNTGAEL